MLPKQYSFKLRSERDFFDKAHKVFSRYFTLFYVPSEQFGLVVVVPKKSVKLSTKRNALKRRINRCVYTALLEENSTPASFFVCLVAKSASEMAASLELEKELKRSFGSLKKK